MLDEREFELINIVGAELGANQRDLSRRLNLSLGMTNMLVRRLITKGYIRIRQFNKKKVEYILTPRGFAEKMRKFYLLGASDLAGLLEMAARELFDQECQLVHVHELSPSMTDGVVLICREDTALAGFESLRSVNVVEELARNRALA